MNGPKSVAPDETRSVLDRFFSIRLGVALADLKAGEVAVAGCERRTYRERGYGFVSLIGGMRLGDRVAVSVHPAAVAEVSRLAWGRSPDAVWEDGFWAEARDALAAALPDVELRGPGRSVTLYHPGDCAPVETEGETRPLTPADADKWEGPRVYHPAARHPSALQGEAFGLFLGDRLAADVMTHEPSVAEMAHLIAQDGIEVAEAHRGRGYGKALLAAWTRQMQARGRVCVHSTSADNAASIAVARSVGYLEYAESRTLSCEQSE